MTTFDLLPDGDAESPPDSWQGEWADARVAAGNGEPPTPGQARALEAIADHIASKGYPPTVRELGKALGIGSPNGVMCHLLQLERKGHIARDPVAARGITVLRARKAVAS